MPASSQKMQGNTKRDIIAANINLELNIAYWAMAVYFKA